MVEKLCELLSRLSGAGEDSTSITSSGSSTAFSTGWALGHIRNLVTIHNLILRGSVDTMGSPKKSDGNGMTWEPCEPLMNVYREKVAIVTNQEKLEENHFHSTKNFFDFHFLPQVDLTTEACKEQLWEKHGGEFGTGSVEILMTKSLLI